MEVSMAFLCQLDLDRYHFQHRIGPETLGAIGKIGCFGGQINKGETAKEAVSREVAEETSIVARPKDFLFLGSVDVISDRDKEEVAVNAWVFRLSLPIDAEIQAKQGKLVTFAVEDIKQNLDRFTPATKKAVEEYL
ncbi:NUDIX domain-containing protein [Candidatus Saccharibacteria bacterium]|nr:NUDIX domain-containing protein [Candidatus Saccharibacteria bacterium]